MCKVIVLPDADTMLERLMAVTDNPHLQWRFFPMFLREAGEASDYRGIAMMVVEAIRYYVHNWSTPFAIMPLMVLIPQIIDALVDDEEVAASALALFKRALKID